MNEMQKSEKAGCTYFKGQDCQNNAYFVSNLKEKF